MKLPFLDRTQELERLRKLLRAKEGSLGVVYGRRRCGKSRLIQEALAGEKNIYYVADETESPLQRKSLAREIAQRIPGFDQVEYPDWNALFRRWWDEAKSGMALVLDEFPYLVSAAPEIPSLLQKHLDLNAPRGVHLVISGSSQRMMQGLVLDSSSPLFGRAREILKISPLPAGWLGKALGIKNPIHAIEAYSVWGGIPRYWELARDHRKLQEAMSHLILDPLGVLHREPHRILQDDLHEVVQAISILNLVGQGCHRFSEIAARLSKPATSLSRPMKRLLELDLIRRDLPFGAQERDSKRSLYRIKDPFFGFWFRYVEPHRSRLETGQMEEVLKDIRVTFPIYVSMIWEELARESVARLELFGHRWKRAHSWWGAGLDRRPLQMNIVSESVDGKALLIGEAKWQDRVSPDQILKELEEKAKHFPLIHDHKVFHAVWSKKASSSTRIKILGPKDVLGVLR